MQKTGLFTLDFTVHCPVLFCPCYKQNIVLKLDFKKSIRSVLYHPGRNITHKIDYLFCGVFKNDKWVHLSLFHNSKDTVFKAMKMADEVLVGLMIRNNHLDDLADNISSYSSKNFQYLKECTEVLPQVWMDAVLLWAQDQNKKITDLPQPSQEQKKFVDTRRLESIKSLNILKVKEWDKPKNSFSWVVLTKSNIKSLIKNKGLTKKFKIADKIKEQLKVDPKAKGTIMLEISDSVPYLVGVIVCVEGGLQIEVKHWYGMISIGRKHEFISFFAMKPELLKRKLIKSSKVEICLCH